MKIGWKPLQVHNICNIWNICNNKRIYRSQTQTSTPKSMEEVGVEVMKIDNATELFQTMVILNLNMGNLTLEVNTLKNILATREKEKAMLQAELDKKRGIQKGYKHNVEIWRKSKVEAEKKIKMFIKKLWDENEELNSNTTWLKLQEEELQNFRQKTKNLGNHKEKVDKGKMNNRTLLIVN